MRSATNSSVVPGYVVDSRMTRSPGARCAPTTSIADSTMDRSGSLSRSGVGTQMTYVCRSSRRAGSAVKRIRPVATTPASSASVMSSTGLCPPDSSETRLSLTSKPTTSWPALAAASAIGRPA